MSSPRSGTRWLVLALSALPLLAQAADPKKKSGKVPDLTLPSFTAIPKGEGIEKPKAEKTGDTPTVTPSSASYSVVRIQHEKGFVRAAGGATAAGGGLS